ncbi:MAG: flagellar biosynthesis protein FlhF [Roseburia sp.]|nr:flagellar biosynthesis protein FlhF [Roseburia sp.]
MTIKKFIGKTKEEAIAKAKEEFGESAVVMNVKEVKPTGFFSFFKSVTYEVTAAVEEKMKFVEPSVNQNTWRSTESINLAADEKIVIPPQAFQSKESPIMHTQPVYQQEVRTPVTPAAVEFSPASMNTSRDEIERKLENLSNILEKKLSAEETRGNELPETTIQNMESFKFMKMLYRTLLDNEVSEKYVNQILDDAEKMANTNSSVDVILSNVYQKMILKFGEPCSISLEGKKPRVVFFIGPTGVGKTTTIAKIASKYKVEEDKKVAFVTADTYRIAATEQLHIYANILDAPMSIVYSAQDLNQAIEKFADYDLIFVDTAGFSHKNEEQKMDIKKLIDGLDEQYEREVFLVLSATIKYKDLLDIVDSYQEISKYKLIFTKLDETTSYGNMLNVRLYSGAELAYMTTGQNVPDDIEEFNSQRIVKQLLGGK